MIEEMVKGVIEMCCEFEELKADECKGVFVSGYKTLEIWKGDELCHFRIFSKNGYSEFSFPNEYIDKIISKLKLK